MTKAGAGTGTPTVIDVLTFVVGQGDPDVAPAPAACAEKIGQPRLDVLPRELLATVRAKIDVADAVSSSSSAPVVVTFVIDQFGDMKDIRLEHNGRSDLSKKIIVPLHTLPKFAPASKNGSNVGTSVKVT